MNNELELKSIGSLLDYSFLVPSYQRGYRWSTEQVEALLNDIWTYSVDFSNPEAFYCLQPIVIKENEDSNFELIDGQQRLTTILLMLHYFNEHEFKTAKKKYALTFKTRILQNDFLEIITDESRCITNIDLYHLSKAYSCVKFWFEKVAVKTPSVHGQFYSKLTERVKVIWYLINDDSSVIDIFTRLNIGKIPLTNAELIKALFLSKSSDNNDGNKFLKQLSIASEWDAIAQVLQNQEFWYFICGKEKRYETRIEFIFDLMKGKNIDDGDNYTFNEFYKDFESGKTINSIWLEVKQNFLTFEDWFKENDFYHLVGFLISTGKSIEEIKKLSHGSSKIKFKDKLRIEARKAIKVPLEDLNFDDHKKEIRYALLLFNIISIIDSKKSNLRFPFNHYHSQHWDIEHIRPRTSKDINNKDKLNWALSVLEYFIGLSYEKKNEKEFREQIGLLKSFEVQGFCNRLLFILEDQDKSGTIFKSLLDDLKKYFKEDVQNDDPDGLSNLTLLDEGTNRMYKNSFFPVKRKHILNVEKRGVFMPLCTKNVFLKAYSSQLGEVMFWGANDAKDYFNELKSTLK